MTENDGTENDGTAARQAWLAILARAETAELEAAFAALEVPPAYRFLRRPESGSVLVRGRIGGSGAPFNLGEMTVTRCTVRLEGGAAGTGYVAGLDHRRAELVAVFDALLLAPERRPDLEARLVAPLAAAQEARRRIRAGKVAATRVDFFTMVRGEG